MNTNKIQTGISITKEEKKIVDEYKDTLGINSFSLTLGMIIRQWREATDQRNHLLSNALDRNDPYWKTKAGIEQSR